MDLKRKSMGGCALKDMDKQMVNMLMYFWVPQPATDFFD